jgi:hypothetical protein
MDLLSPAYPEPQMYRFSDRPDPLSALMSILRALIPQPVVEQSIYICVGNKKIPKEIRRSQWGEWGRYKPTLNRKEIVR